MGIRRVIGQALRKLSSRLLPLIAYFSLVFGRRRRRVGDPAQIIEVRDRGSEVTVVSFAGIAALHGGMVNFEFTEILRRFAFEPNIVFVRDPLCSCYHLRPDGSGGGLDYYTDEVRRAVRRLGGRHVVAVGTSIGGMAAIAVGDRIGFDQVFAFSPSWPPPRYFLERGFGAWVARMRLLLRSPAAYLERLLLAQMAWVSARRLREEVGDEGLLDLEGQLASSRRVPRITVFYGDGCLPDARTAHAIKDVASAELVSLPTPMHNTSAYLRQRGRLISEIVRRVEQRVAERELVPTVSSPPPPMAVVAPADARPVSVAS